LTQPRGWSYDGCIYNDNTSVLWAWVFLQSWWFLNAQGYVHVNFVNSNKYYRNVRRNELWHLGR
jgi:hypothetical protein